MKIRYVTLLAAIAGLMAACGNDRKVEPDPSLKEAASGKFLMGVALNVRQAAGQDTYASKVVKRHFNSIVAENCMKCEVIHPEEDRFDFTEGGPVGSFWRGERYGCYRALPYLAFTAGTLVLCGRTRKNSKCRHLEGAYKKTYPDYCDAL